MGYRLYILSICDLADESVRETAIAQLDSHRKELVNKYKREQDRWRAIAAGLLLQVGFLELELSGRVGVLEVLKHLQDYAKEHAVSLPVPLSYTYGTHGKPEWERRCIDELWDEIHLGDSASVKKKFPCFNLSHSGDYVVLAISDTPVGVDIQMERDCDYPGGYKAFSHMEAYVKCTGEGIAHGRKKYEEMNGKIERIDFAEFLFGETDICCVCLERLE